MYPVGYNPNIYVSDPGERYKQEYIGDVNLDGSISLVPSGKIDLWELHNAGRDACDINKIVQRFQNGDLTVLNRVQGSYADLAGVPTDIRSMTEIVHRLEHGFDILPADVKSKFGTFSNFIDMYGSAEFAEIMSSRSESEAVPMNNNSSAESDV